VIKQMIPRGAYKSVWEEPGGLQGMLSVSETIHLVQKLRNVGGSKKVEADEDDDSLPLRQFVLRHCKQRRERRLVLGMLFFLV
jgi:hypothetical protein